MFKKQLFGLDTKGNVKTWICEVFGNEIHVSHGRKDGKMQTKVTVCEGKNIGRANETTPEKQALLEAQSKVNKQIDKRYRETEEELNADDVLPLPMLAHDYTKVGHRMTWPCAVSPKLDGVRCLAFITPESVVFQSRGGKPYIVPPHIEETLKTLCVEREADKLILDGELYIHGESLQNIVSAVKKPNELSQKLEYWVFDVPSHEVWEYRAADLSNIFMQLPLNSCVKIVNNMIAHDEDQAKAMLHYYLERGFEGLMLRDLSGVYEYNFRSSGLMKWKEFQDIEAKVIGVSKDRNEEGVLKCRLKNGVEFECKMIGNHEYRLFDNQMKLIGEWINVKFQQYTDDGKPQFPVGMSVRDCDDQGNPLI